ncbi:Cellulose/chitin-binding protein N-terminal [Trinorchestia longiramus]|nr:Cellulose/chitin-binding protein N-terminal [Trinorchestia longiramus]
MKSFGLASAWLLSILGVSWCHVALLDPPARNVLWRSGYSDLPKHEDDDYLYCFQKENEQCPPCGDSNDSPKPYAHQAGGKWALGIIGRNYTAGEVITVKVSVTNSHGGHMMFKLCPNNDVNKPVTQKCLDGYPLEVSGYTGGKVPVTAPYQSTQDFQLQLKLPTDLVCSQCVMQMTQYTEQFKPSDVIFRNCADIGIFSQGTTLSSSQRSRSKNSSKSSKKSSLPERFFDQTVVAKVNRQPQFQISNQGPSDLTIADQLSLFGNTPQNAQLSSGKRSPSFEQVQILDHSPIFAYGPDFINGGFDFKAALEFNNQQFLQQVENNRDGNKNFLQQGQSDANFLNPLSQQVLNTGLQNQRPLTPNFLLASSPSHSSSLSQSPSLSSSGDSSLATTLLANSLKPKQRTQQARLPFQNPEQITVLTGSLENQKQISQTHSLFQKSKQIASQTGSSFQNSKQITSQTGSVVDPEKFRLREHFRPGNISKKQKSSSKRESDPNVALGSPDSQLHIRSKAMFPEPSPLNEPGYILAHIY